MVRSRCRVGKEVCLLPNRPVHPVFLPHGTGPEALFTFQSPPPFPHPNVSFTYINSNDPIEKLWREKPLGRGLWKPEIVEAAFVLVGIIGCICPLVCRSSHQPAAHCPPQQLCSLPTRRKESSLLDNVVAPTAGRPQTDIHVMV